MTVKRILGLAKLNNKLRRLPDAPKRDIQAALEKQANRITDLMRNLVPVDEGTLRDSIGWTWGRAPRGSISILTAGIGDQLTLTIYAGNDEAYYARWVEFGTQTAAASPYFFPAYRALRRSTRSSITRAVRKAARKVAQS